MSKLDKTLFRFYENNKLSGLLVTHVDDVLYSGNTKFNNEIIKTIFKKFKISSEYRDSFRYLGLNVSQDKDHVITVDQEDYAKSIKVISLGPERRKELESELTEEERSSYQSTLGKLLWMSGRTRPDICYDTMELSTFTKSAKIKDILLINKAVKKVKDFSSKTYFRPLNLKTDALRILVYSDASLGNLPNSGSCRGYVVFIGNQAGVVNLLNWSANKIKRVVHSAFAAETLGCIDAIAAGIYCRQLISEIVYNNPRSKIIEIYGFVDNMQLFEQVTSTKQPLDKRIRLDIAEMQETVQKEIANVIWVPTKDQLADSLTKRGSDYTKLAQVIESGYCRTAVNCEFSECI